MDREQTIKEIEGLFPADSEYPEGAEVGQRLLEQAKREVCGWRTESTEVLIRYAQLCIAEENRQARKYDKRYSHPL